VLCFVVLCFVVVMLRRSCYKADTEALCAGRAFFSTG